jgi:hypothetical protein
MYGQVAKEAKRQRILFAQIITMRSPNVMTAQNDEISQHALNANDRTTTQ